jgi:hypothetical protein
VLLNELWQIATGEWSRTEKAENPLYWLTRVQMRGYRIEVNEDPVDARPLREPRGPSRLGPGRGLQDIRPRLGFRHADTYDAAGQLTASHLVGLDLRAVKETSRLDQGILTKVAAAVQAGATTTVDVADRAGLGRDQMGKNKARRYLEAALAAKSVIDAGQGARSTQMWRAA